jgi:hypothetical protein
MILLFILAVAVFTETTCLSTDAGQPNSIDTHVSFKNDRDLNRVIAAIFSEEFGYTLIGEKPVSLDESFLCLRGDEALKEKVGNFLELAFKNSPNFIVQTPVRNKRFSFCLIHKLALKRVINETEELKEFVRDRFLTVDRLFYHIQNTEESIFKIFKHKDFLLGLILGYGRANSEYYCRRNTIGEYLKKPPFFQLFPMVFNPNIYLYTPISIYFPDDYPRSSRKPTPKKEFGSLEAEWAWIRKMEWNLDKLCGPTPPYHSHYAHLPFYICRHGGDSEQIRDKYIKARSRLANLFYKRIPTEVVLEEASKKSRHNA